MSGDAERLRRSPARDELLFVSAAIEPRRFSDHLHTTRWSNRRHRSASMAIDHLPRLRGAPIVPGDSRRFADVGLQPGQAHRGRRRRLREDARPAPARDHAGAGQAPPRLRARGRPHARRMARRHPLPHRDRPDLDREAPRVHPAVGHAGPVDDDRLAGPGARQRRRAARPRRPRRRSRARSTGRARPTCRSAPTSAKAFPASRRSTGAASPTATASRSPARCSTSGRATATASTTSSSPTRRR